MLFCGHFDIYISLMIYDNEVFHMTIGCPYIFFWEARLSTFFEGDIAFTLLVLGSILYILDINSYIIYMLYKYILPFSKIVFLH